MSINTRPLWIAGLALLLAIGIDGCVATDAGYNGDVDVGVSAGFYEPYGYDYGGWGPGYFVGPGRGGEQRGGSGRAHTYRPAPASRHTPSIPSRSRGSGGSSAGNRRR
jgi:hypothetical protein